MQGVEWLRDASRARQAHGAPELPVALTAIATPDGAVDAPAPEFVPVPFPIVVTTSPRVVPRSAAIPPPPPRLEPVDAPRRASRNAGPAVVKATAPTRPVTPSAAVVEPAGEATTDIPSIPEPTATREQTAMTDPQPKPIPREDPPRESPAIQEPPPDSPPREVPEIREPPPTDVPTEGATAQ
jgi:hypothetical protein